MKTFTPVLLAILLYGCGPSIKYAPFDSQYRSPTLVVDVYSDVSRVTRKYKEIGIVTARGDDNEEKLLQELRERAASKGADAIIIEASEPLRRRPNRIGAISWGGAAKAMRAIAIVYIQDEDK